LSRLDKEFPEGDRGGNDFPLTNHDSIDELHALWDAVIYTTHASEHIVRNIFSNLTYFLAFHILVMD
jgi:hypothetical protein